MRLGRLLSVAGAIGTISAVAIYGWTTELRTQGVGYFLLVSGLAAIIAQIILARIKNTYWSIEVLLGGLASVALPVGLFLINYSTPDAVSLVSQGSQSYYSAVSSAAAEALLVSGAIIAIGAYLSRTSPWLAVVPVYITVGAVLSMSSFSEVPIDRKHAGVLLLGAVLSLIAARLIRWAESDLAIASGVLLIGGYLLLPLERDGTQILVALLLIVILVFITVDYPNVATLLLLGLGSVPFIVEMSEHAAWAAIVVALISLAMLVLGLWQSWRSAQAAPEKAAQAAPEKAAQAAPQKAAQAAPQPPLVKRLFPGSLTQEEQDQPRDQEQQSEGQDNNQDRS